MADRLTVCFPVVVGGERGQLTELTLIRHRESDGAERFARCPELSSMCRDLINARFRERGPMQTAGVIGMLSERRVQGDSYGLALAIGDRMLRYGAATHRPVVATGRIVPSGGGQIGAIDDFLPKLHTIIDAAPDCLFAFPAMQQEQFEPEGKILLDAARAAGIELLPVADVIDAARLWRRPSRLRPIHIFSAVLLSLVAIGTVAKILYDRPPRRCERIVDRLDATSPPTAAAPALEACRAAVKSDPDDGRSHFLLAQALFLNGSRVLGEREWQRSARLGDPDGLAAYGRHLWLDGSGDALANGNAALPWLKRAAAAGSAAAMEDIAALLRDPGRTSKDHVEAERWDRQAHALRQQQQRNAE